MGISGSLNGGTVPYKAIFSGDIPLHRPEKIGLIYGRYLRFRFLRWPVIILLFVCVHQFISRYIARNDVRENVQETLYIFGCSSFPEIKPLTYWVSLKIDHHSIHRSITTVPDDRPSGDAT